MMDRRSLLLSLHGLITLRPSISWADNVPFEQYRQQILHRIREDLMDLHAGNVYELASKLDSRGLWQDVDYDDKSLGAWEPIKHLERLSRMVVAHESPSHKLSKDRFLRDSIISALDAWIDLKPFSRNWWYNTIGCQFHYSRLLVVFSISLKPLQQLQLLEWLYVPADAPINRRTGQNHLWYATQQLIRGVVSGRQDDVIAASSDFNRLLQYSSGEGLKKDYSFHQHGPQLYSGGYGLQFYIEMVERVSWLHGSPWEIGNESVHRLLAFGENGIAPLIRGTWLDWGAMGREFSRNEPVGRRSGNFHTARRRLHETMNIPLQKTQWRGTHHFWQSEFLAHQSSDLYISIKAPSNRTVGTESGNGENLLGYWLSFGSTFFTKNGDDYNGILNSMEWSKIPGVTSLKEVPKFKGYQSNESNFACGLSSNNLSVMAMSLSKSGLTAHKAWILSGDQLICLGTGIISERSPCHTTINQCRLHGAVKLNDRTVSRGDNVTGNIPATISHNGLRYRLQKGNQFNLALKGRSINGRLINSSMPPDDTETATFTLTIDHSVSKAEDYFYIVEPLGPTESNPTLTWNVVINAPDAQALHCSKTDTVIGACRTSTVIRTAIGELILNQACAFIVRKNSRSVWEISLGLPTGYEKITSLEVKLKNISGTQTLLLSQCESQLNAYRTEVLKA